MSIRTIASREVYRNRWMTVREDRIERADGSHGIYSVVDKPPAALIVPVTAGDVYLIEQFRYPVGARFFEFPQGAWEDRADADPLELARGELREETGLRAGRMEPLGTLFFAYGITGQPVHLFRATELEAGERELEPTEQDLVCHRLPIAEFEAMIARNQIRDAATIAAWYLHRNRP
jgi:8-oxo-dGTP pyrophosphatase MutT (NUDIX family)